MKSVKKTDKLRLFPILAKELGLVWDKTIIYFSKMMMNWEPE